MNTDKTLINKLWWSEITENGNFPKSMTQEQKDAIEKALFAYIIDGDIDDFHQALVEVNVAPPYLGNQ